MDLSKLIDAFKEHKGVGFISFPYENAQKELARRLVNIGISYENAKKRDLTTLIEGIEYIENTKYTKADWDMAISELKVSCDDKAEKSQESLNRSEGAIKNFITLTDNGTLKYNTVTQELYIVGSSVKKTVEVAGVYKEVKSSGKTIAKNVIKKHYLSTGDFRTFKVGNLKGNIKINGDILFID